MDPEEVELETPALLAVEEKLVENYTAFDLYRMEWNREWQKAMQARSMRRLRERRAQANSAIPHEDDAA